MEGQKSNNAVKILRELCREAEKGYILDLCDAILPDISEDELEMIVSAFAAVCAKEHDGPELVDASVVDCRLHLKKICDELNLSEAPETERVKKTINAILRNAGDRALNIPARYLEQYADLEVDNTSSEYVYINTVKSSFSDALRYYRFDPEVSSEARQVMDVLCFYCEGFSVRDLPAILTRVNNYYELANLFDALTCFLVDWSERRGLSLSSNMASALGAFLQDSIGNDTGADDELTEAVIDELLKANRPTDFQDLDYVLPDVEDFAEDGWSAESLTMDELYQVLDELCELGYISYTWSIQAALGDDFMFTFDPMPMQRVAADVRPGTVLESACPGLEMPAPFEEQMNAKAIADFMASVHPALIQSKETASVLLGTVNDILFDVSRTNDELLCAVGGFGLPQHAGRREAAVAHYPLLAPVTAVFFSDKHIYLSYCFEGVSLSAAIDPAIIKEVSINVCSGYGDDVTNQLHEPYAKLQVLMDAEPRVIGPQPDDILGPENNATNGLFPVPFEVYLPRYTDEQLIQLAGYIQFALKEMKANVNEVVFSDEDDI